MDDERELLRQQREGAAAKAEYQHPVMVKAFAALEEQLKAQRLQVRARDVEMHTELIRREQTLGLLRQYFLDTIATGEAATMELNHRKTMAERLADFTGVSRL